MALSDNAIAQLADLIENESRIWVQEYIRVRQATLRKRGINASEKLIHSFAYSLTKSLNTAVTNTIELSFEDYGRFVEMKRMDVPAGGADLIANLAAWIVKKGFQEKFQRSFMTKRGLKKPPQDMLNKMAWGIAIKRSKGYRRRAWYAKSKTAAITDLFNQVASNIPDLVLQELKAALTKK